ncbi:MAG: radical SAM protein [Nitrospiraceae bacterium]|nr:MAG: radical SAM protein [Nitrospiraceae bacterium]
MIELIPRIPLFKLFRSFGVPGMLPVSLTVSVTGRCNSRCMTCNIYNKKTGELSLEEYEKIFSSIGKAPYWITFSGGEPFLREDIAEICKSAYKNCGPKIINIPTNGLLSDRIEKGVRAILDGCPGSSLIINLSIDGIGERHDEIRGVKGCFERAMSTYERLKSIKHKNLTVGIHTVISRYNAKEIPSLYKRIKELKPDSYITEIAEERVELGTIGAGITPSLRDYSAAVDFLSNEMKDWDMKGLARITRAFRMRYYQTVKKILKDNKEVIPCFAAFASCQITPEGDVWACCIKAENMGALRDAGYDFRKTWFSDKAKEVRNSIRQGKCFCPLANASYTNMLFTPQYLFFGRNSR